MTPNPSGDGGFMLSGTSMYNPNSEAAVNAKQNLAVPMNDILKGLFSSYSQDNAGTDFMKNYLSGGAGPDPSIMADAANVKQYGTTGGYPGELIHGQAQFGGNGAPGAAMDQIRQWGGSGSRGLPAMALAMEYGAPSQAGQYTANQAQFGVSSEGAGRALANRAYGGQTAATNYLMPFLNAPKSAPYQAPAINARQVYRNVKG